MIQTNPMMIFSVFTIVFMVVTPIWGLWAEFFKRKPYITNVRKDVPY